MGERFRPPGVGGGELSGWPSAPEEKSSLD